MYSISTTNGLEAALPHSGVGLNKGHCEESLRFVINLEERLKKLAVHAGLPDEIHSKFDPNIVHSRRTSSILILVLVPELSLLVRRPSSSKMVKHFLWSHLRGLAIGCGHVD